MTDDYSMVDLKVLSEALVKGQLVPVLGAGANLADRQDDAFDFGRNLPSGQELAEFLARKYSKFGFPNGYDLARVTQYLGVEYAWGWLSEQLHDIFDADYTPTVLHHFLARLSRRSRESGRGSMLLVTTNYDDLLENAFKAAGEPFDLLTYIAQGAPNQMGKFWHTPFNEPRVLVKVPRTYINISLDERPVIVKLHGTVDRLSPANDSYVVTEDHYADYITRADFATLFPTRIAEKLVRSQFLFLGYSLRDWNLRVMLYRLWREQTRKGKESGHKSWAVQANPDPIDRLTWGDRNVRILPISLDRFVTAIDVHLPVEWRLPL